MKAVFDIHSTIKGHTLEVHYTNVPKDVQKLQGMKVIILESLVDELFYFTDINEEELRKGFKEWADKKKKEFNVK